MSRYDTPDGWDMGREQADYEQAELEAAGAAYARATRRVKALVAMGKKEEAARYCPHGGGYPLNSLAAKNSKDPRAGQAGHRCLDCGSVLDRPSYVSGAVVLVPCELEPR
jgi:hypothetical protein